VSELDLSSFIAQELAFDGVRAEAHARDASRGRGVTWSGLGPEPWRARSAAQVEASARARLACLQAWRASAAGRFLAAVANAQHAAEMAHVAGEAARAAIARGMDPGASSCRQAADALEAEGRALLAAARAARRALASTNVG
jgi:hypothetical protein